MKAAANEIAGAAKTADAGPKIGDAPKMVQAVGKPAAADTKVDSRMGVTTGRMSFVWPRALVPDVSFTHAPCPDGMATRMLIQSAFPGAPIEFRDWRHGGSIDFSGLDGKVVHIGDACPTRAQLSKELVNVRYLFVGDHHANQVNVQLAEELAVQPQANVMLLLDRTGERCAALMTFEALYPGAPIPPWLDAINKGDTNLISTRTADEKAYHAWLTRPDALKSVETLQSASKADVKQATAAGKLIIEARLAEVAKSLAAIEFKDVKTSTNAYKAAYVVATGPEIISAISEHAFAKKLDIQILCIRWVTKDGVKQISLRTVPGSKVDVAVVAQQFGGNGHPLAAGVQGRDYLE